ncbi:Alpha/Beta hydrolase protein [Usnea florida]
MYPLCPLFLTVLLWASALAHRNTTPPIVDLGYTLHQATTTENDVSYLNFSNIRYAAPPTGDLRFAAPVRPSMNRTVQDGQMTSICPQAQPGWITTAQEFTTGEPITTYRNYTVNDIPPVDPRTSEDCLFLNVLVSSAVYERRKNSTGAAVLVWIHGGGFTIGWKEEFGSGQDFIALSAGNRDGGVVYVAINYRLGLFGWLGGISDKNDAVANAGLLDQRFALDWVQKYIHLFGGDPHRVTVMGESAGGGAIMYQITAYGGTKGPVPFRRAITQSAYLQPIPYEFQDRAYRAVLTAAHVSTYKELKSIPSSDLQTANSLVVGNAEPYGSFVFGPIIDNSFVPDLASILLGNGQYDHNLTIIAGHNSDEGLYFTSPSITDSSSYYHFLRLQFPSISSTALTEITQTLYPPPDTNPSIGYSTPNRRAALTIGDYLIVCNGHYLTAAFPNASYAYRFSVPPGIHGFDLPYTFYVNGTATSPTQSINTTLAVLMQRYFLNFATAGSPNGMGVPRFPSYEGEAEEILSSTVLGPVHDDDLTAKRCKWWQQALYR